MQTTDSKQRTPQKAAQLALRALCMVMVAAVVQGCHPQPSSCNPAAFDGQRAFSEVAALVEISPRDAGTPGARKAAEHLLQRLQDFGVTAQIDTFQDNTPEGMKTFHNVVGRIPGKTDRWIILGSHFDTMPGIPNFQGANDSGSSTGVLLEMARNLSGHQSELGIIFAFFDGEEGIAHYIPGDGLHGSRYMAAQLLKTGEAKKIDSMILLDMVGDRDLQFTIPYNVFNELAQDFLAVAKACGERNRVKLSKINIVDDHVPFMKAGIPAIDLIDFKFGSAPGLNDYWHTEADNLDHISASSLHVTGTLVHHLLIRRNERAKANP